MSFYRLSPSPLMEISPFFLNRFALNLQAPERGPLVPVPGQDGFGERPFRADPQGLRESMQAIAGRYPAEARSDRIGDWEISNLRHEPHRALSSIWGVKKENGELRASFQFFSNQESVKIEAGRYAKGIGGISQISHWSPKEEGNVDHIRFHLLSKKGPPSWKGLSVGLAELAPWISLILFEASPEEGVCVRSSVHRSWEHNASLLDRPETVESLLDAALRGPESFTARTHRMVHFRDEYQLDRKEGAVQMRCFKPWKRAPSYLELTYWRTPSSGDFPPSFLDLARRVLGFLE